MKTNRFGFAYVGEPQRELNEAGGVTITVNPAFLSERVDWENPENVRAAASKAINMAKGFYVLIHENLNLESPLCSNTNIEIYVAMGAFACELFLKGIIYMENRHDGKVIQCHRLQSLINMLSEESRTNLYSHNTDFEDKLEALSNSFTEMRYMYEYNTIDKEYLLVFDLLDALKSMAKKYDQDVVATSYRLGSEISVHSTNYE